MSEEVKDIQRSAEGKNETSSYRSIFKATSLFGGVQVYQILIGIIKSKFVAVLLGPAGMGIQGLYQSTLDLIKSVTAFGLDQSAVRDISEANGSGDAAKISRTVATIRRLVWLTGTLGLIITLVLSPLLSKLTFGNGDYTLGFAILSVTLLINQLWSGQKVLLQGMRRLKDLAKASAIGSTIGLVVSVPLYYWIGVKGIVPTMVLTSITAMLLSWFYSKKIKIEKTSVTTKEALSNGHSMIKMGIAMSISGILVALFSYVLRWFIRKQGGVDEVGLFSAGFLIINTYVGMVFNAMNTDYYPRLAAVNKDNNRCCNVINQQGEIAVLILAPIIVSCILFMPFIIRLVYSEKFLLANNFIMFAIMGMMFKAGSWVVAYAFLAKAESRLFIINETVTNIYSLLLNLIGYYWGGLTGLGLSYLLNYTIYLLQVYLIARYRYNFRYSHSFIRIFITQFLLVLISFILMYCWHSFWVYIPAGIVFVICGVFSLRELEKRLYFMNTIKQKFSSK